MDLPAGAGRDLFFRFLLARLSNSWAHRTPRNSSRGRISSRRGRIAGPRPRLVVRTYIVVDGQWPSHAHCLVLGGYGRVTAAGFKPVAAGNAADLLCVLSFVRERGAGFFRLPVGRDVARGGIHCTLLCSGGISPRFGERVAAIARESVSAAVGMVSHLLRVGCGKNRRRRSRVASLYSHGRVLPERPAAHVDRLVRTASAARVPRNDGFCDAGTGIGFSVDVVSA